MSVVIRVWSDENPTKRLLNQCSVDMRQKLTINPKMLSVVSAGVTAAGMGGGMDRLGGGGGGPGSGARELTAAAATREHRQMRLHSVDTHTDITINLPPSIEMPDGEEHPFTSSRLHIRDAEQESEIYQKCIRPPPNRTVLESESPPPYRSCSAGMLSTSSSSSGSSDWSTSSPTNPLVVRCHSMSSTSSKSSLNTTSTAATTPAIQKTDFLQRTVKIFTGGGKKTVYQQPPPAPALPVVIVPTVMKIHRGAGGEHRSKHHHDV
ncbi:unnamed protein product [Psylliodes chrysocephalus]|uniref:Uncharacterized protein n=1 Tax=Psylliodes chrysocephalus TaxID=3402493 RepID=A0A9P0GEA7_9CUCU|nr:unnamed protein product [Psylliodes chrysocephala]